MPGLRVDGRDDPVPGDPPGDPEHPIVAFVQVLAGHRGQQRRRLREHRPQLLAVEGGQQPAGVFGQRIHQRLPGSRVIVVTRRLARPQVIVVAGQQGAQPRLPLASDREQPADRRADQRHGVHRGHRVIQRSRVEHPPPAHQPGLRAGLQRHLEDPVRARRAGQPGPHVHQHGMHEPRIAEVQPAGRVLPPGIKAEPVGRLPVASTPRTAAAPSPRPRSSAAPTAARHHQTGPRTSRRGTARSTPGARSRRSSPAPPAPRKRRPWTGTDQPCLGARPSVIDHPRRTSLQLQQFSRNDQETCRTARLAVKGLGCPPTVVSPRPTPPPVLDLADLGIKVTLCGCLERRAAPRRVWKAPAGRCIAATPAGGWRPGSKIWAHVTHRLAA